MTPADLRALIEKAESTSPREDYREWAVAQQRLDHALRTLAPHFAALWDAVERRMYAERGLNRHAGVAVEDEDWEVFRHAELMERQALSALTAAARELGGAGV